eukprot:6264284-Amphidinium_carterae.5
MARCGSSVRPLRPALPGVYLQHGGTNGCTPDPRVWPGVRRSPTAGGRRYEQDGTRVTRYGKGILGGQQFSCSMMSGVSKFAYIRYPGLVVAAGQHSFP